MEFLPHIATIVVALIGGLAAWATQRNATRATRTTAVEASRTDMEKEAYNRAVAFDTATINRQTGLIEELNERNDRYRERERELEETTESQRDEIKELQLALEDRESTIRDLQAQLEAREDSTQ